MLERQLHCLHACYANPGQIEDLIEVAVLAAKPFAKLERPGSLIDQVIAVKPGAFPYISRLHHLQRFFLLC